MNFPFYFIVMKTCQVLKPFPKVCNRKWTILSSLLGGRLCCDHWAGELGLRWLEQGDWVLPDGREEGMGTSRLCSRSQKRRKCEVVEERAGNCGSQRSSVELSQRPWQERVRDRQWTPVYVSQVGHHETSR